MSQRQERVAAAIRKEVANLLLTQMRDPRLALASITGAEVSRDWSVARVFVSAMGEQAELNQAVEALNGAAGFVRTQIAGHLTIRHMPELVFLPDDTARKAQRLENIFREDSESFRRDREG